MFRNKNIYFLYEVIPLCYSNDKYDLYFQNIENFEFELIDHSFCANKMK